MKRYLDPKNDLVFKKVFGEHPDVLRAFLNALLPLEPDGKIESLEYLTPEQAPEIPLHKYTIVDVRCRDQRGRQFIVEMQMQWTTAFLQRVVFNASKAYVRQLEKGEQYEFLQPVIGLSLLNDVFDQGTSDFYHHYKILNVKDLDREIKGLQLVFIELPKFAPEENQTDLGVWLRYLRETGKKDGAPEELAGHSREVKSALELAEWAAYTPAELLAYDRYWDAVSTEKTLVSGKLAEGRAVGRAEGRREGLEEGIRLGVEKGKDQALQRLVENGLTEVEARRLLGL